MLVGWALAWGIHIQEHVFVLLRAIPSTCHLHVLWSAYNGISSSVRATISAHNVVPSESEVISVGLITSAPRVDRCQA